MNRGDSRIAKILQESRIHQGLSQRELSQRSGLTQAQISRIENGKVDLRLSSLVALVNVLELELILTPRTLGQPALTRQEKPPRATRNPPKKTPVFQVSEEPPRPGLLGDMTDDLL